MNAHLSKAGPSKVAVLGDSQRCNEIAVALKNRPGYDVLLIRPKNDLVLAPLVRKAISRLLEAYKIKIFDETQIQSINLNENDSQIKIEFLSNVNGQKFIENVETVILSGNSKGKVGENLKSNLC